MHGPGPGCLDPARERSCGRARGKVGRALAGRARMRTSAMSPVFQLGRARAIGPAEPFCKENNSAVFSISRISFPIEFD
jgi:hypothetical protein